ncbi:MAG: hypothetical protein JWQ04_1223 [Pedosphaera sp.]|nr:hypothetical protein [Pedosphaera sp.]
MRVPFCRFLSAVACFLSCAAVSFAQNGTVNFGSGGFYAHASQGSATVFVQGNNNSQFPVAASIFAHSTNTSHPPPSTAVFFTDYTTNSVFQNHFGEGAGAASLSGPQNNTVSFQIPLLVNTNLPAAGRTIVLGFWSAAGGTTIVAPSTCTITIISDPLVTLTATKPSASENGPTPGEFTVTRYGEMLDDLTVNLTVTGTATYTSDYSFTGSQVTSPTTVVIPAGTASATITVSPVDDSLPEPDETVIAALAPGTYTTNTQSVATVTISDNDPLVNITATDASASEGGDSGLFTITRTADPSIPLTVFYTITGTAKNGVDYAFITNSVTLQSGETYKPITIAPTGSILTNSPATVILTLVSTNTYTLGTPTSGTVTITNYNDSARPVPTNSFGLAANARTGRFLRGSGTIPSYWSFVIPVDLEKGVPLDNIGGVATNLFSPNPWTNTLSHYNATNSGRFSFQNPIASFGSRVGGSPLYYGQPYTFGVYAGDPAPTAYTNANAYTNAIRIQVYQQGTMAFVGTTVIGIPNPASSTEWAAFITNGYTKAVTNFGLTTILTFDQPGLVTWDTFPGVSGNDFAYHLIHTASQGATNYVYMVELAGGIASGWMVVDGSNARSWSRLYTMEYESRPPWRAVVVDQPTFQAVPMPPSYLGMSPDELATNSPPVTNTVALSPSTCTNLDQSPELRRHPILDQFVANLGKDPMLLANYVINEIELTDAIDYSDSGVINEIAVNPGGVSRGALGTFLEKQGSPVEQCGLLIYLLRQAGVPATYVFPPHNGLLMVDTRLSTLLRMQVRGAVRHDGLQYTTSTLIPVNYPWVAAYIGTNWVHIFPWLKDTEVSEGFDLHDFLPPPDNTPYKWSRDYIYGATNILNLSREDDTPMTLYPLWLKKTLNESVPGMSLDDFGMHFRNRPQYRSRWTDFPNPTYVTNSSIAVESLGSTGITNVNPAFTNIFDTINVEVKSVTNPGTKVSSGDLKLAELNDRRFLIRHDFVDANTARLVMSLAPFRTNIATVRDFSTVTQVFPPNTNALCYLVSSNTLGVTDNSLQVTIVHKWHRSLPSGFSIPNPDSVYLGYNSSLVFTNIRTMRKGDFAAVCLDMGRVNQAMLNVHAQDIWQMEQQIAATPSITNSLPADRYRGDVLYLMGMSYFKKCDDFRQFTTPLHKANILRFHASGLASLVAKHNPDGTLPNGQIILVQPKVDMFYKEIAIVGGSTYHLEDGDDTFNQADRWFDLFITAGSAAEHGILNQFFGQSDAISTIKLLRLSLTQTTNGIINLNRYNYVTEGNKTYPASSTNKLKDFVPTLWQAVTNAFTASYSSNNVEAFVTPGLIRNASSSYQGMGALILSPGTFSALIGPNNYNGGFGENMPDPSFDPNNLTQTKLSQDENGDFSYQTSAGTASAPNLVSPVDAAYDAGNTISGISSGAAKLDPTQTSELDAYKGQSGDASNVRSTQYQDMQNNGALAQTVNPDYLQAIQDPVNSIAGDFYVDDTDLVLPGPFPLQVRRNYSSHNLFDDELGYGWKLCYFPYLAINQGTNTMNCAESDGTVVTYRQIVGNTNLYQPQIRDNPRLQNCGGSFANLLNGSITKLVTNSVTSYTMKSPDGSKRVFTVKTFPISTLMRSRPYLDSWTDSRGNFLRFYYGSNSANTDYGLVNRIEANNGNFLSLQYDVSGHLTDIFTGDERHVSYQYDTFGDLVTVTRADASQIQYEYQHLNFVSSTLTDLYSSHLLIHEFKPEGRALENQYDSQRRVIQQSSTVGYDLRLVRNASFAYSNNFNLTNYWTNFLTGFTLVSDCFSNVTRFDYTNSLLRKITDPLNRITLQDWYATNDVSIGAYPNGLKSTTDPRLLVTTRMYDSFGNVTNVTTKGDLTGNGNTNETAVVSTAYNANLLATSIIDPVGNQTVYTYTNTTYPYLRTTEERYASSGTPISIMVFTYYDVTNSPPSGFTNFVGSFGLLRRIVRASGTSDAATNEWLYDAHGFPIQQTSYTGTGDPAVTKTMFYNLRGELVESDDAAGRATVYTYDGMGRPESQEVFDEYGDRVSVATSYYNGNGELTWSDGPRSAPEDYAWRDYDGAGRKVQEVHWRTQAAPDATGVQAPAGDALYASSFFEYDPFGNLIKSIDPRGNYQRMKYDAAGQLMEQRAYDGTTGQALSTNRFGYEPGGLVAFATNAVGGVTAKVYTWAGRLEFQSNPDGSTNGWTYYLDGRLRRQIQRNGAYSETTYDDANRIATRIFYASGGSPLATNSLVFDRRGNVIQTVNAASNVFTNTYDGLDRIKISAGPAIVSVSGTTNIIGPGGGLTTNFVQQVTTNFYDAAGVVFTNINALGEQTVTAYDALNRTTDILVYAPSNATPVRVREFDYSADQHLVTVWEGTGSNAVPTQYGLDNAGRTIVTFRYPTYPTSGLIEFTTQDYDATGNLTARKQCSWSNFVVTVWSTNAWTYDGLNRVSTETGRDGATTTFAYDALGNVTNRVMPGNILGWTATYNNAGQILTENDSNGAQTARHFTYTYYPLGDQWAGLRNTVTDDRSVVQTNSYDNYLRVAGVAATGPLTEQQMSCSWQYDPRGLLTTITQSYANTNANPTTTITRSYDPYGQLTGESTSLNGSGLTSAGAGWDSAGRRASVAGMSFHYRADGLMSGVNGATFGYGDNGLMTGRTNSPRAMTVDQRDGAGRPVQATTRVNLSTVLTENWNWTPDDLPASYTANRSDYTDSRQFTYGAAHRRLTQETLNLGIGQSVTNNYTFDNGAPGGLGVLTQSGQSSSQPATSWNGGLDAFSRVSTETNTVIHRSASGSVNGAATLRGYLNGQGLDVHYDSHSASAWSVDMALVPGTNTLAVYADHPSGLFTTNRASTFIVTNAAFDNEISGYDGAGNVTSRVWKRADGQVVRTQTLTWDAFGQLVKVTERDTNNNGFNFESDFDGLGRQVRTIETTVSNNVALAANPAPVTVAFTYDLQVEFLIAGINVSQGINSRQDSLAYGPDLSGYYGGMQGVGGLESVTSGPFNTTVTTINDTFGNVLGAVTNGAVAWNASRVNLYGPVDGYAPPRLSLTAPAYSSLAWRTRPLNAAGLIHLGARPYDYARRAFLSPDPLGHDSDSALNTAFMGNPAKFFDPEGRYGKTLPFENFAMGNAYDRDSQFRALIQNAFSSYGISGATSWNNLPYSVRLGAIMAEAGGNNPTDALVDNRSFGQKSADFARENILNQPQRDAAWNELVNHDFSTAWGVATFIDAGISYTANTVDAGANLIPIVGTGKMLVEDAVKVGIKQVGKVFVKDAAEDIAKTEAKQIEKAIAEDVSKSVPKAEQLEFKFTEPVSGPYDQIANPKNVTSGGEFTAAQKKAYYEANMEANGGVLKDDVTGETLQYPQKSQRGVTPPPNEAQIDHYYPSSEGGLNSSANARVRSREANRAKSNATPW